VQNLPTDQVGAEMKIARFVILAIVLMFSAGASALDFRV
jgi:hypothetical protein